MKTLKKENSQKSSAHKVHSHGKGDVQKLLYDGHIRFL